MTIREFQGHYTNKPFQGEGRTNHPPHPQKKPSCSRRFNALSRAAQAHSRGNSRDIMPIRPAANRVSCPPNTTRIDKDGVGFIIYQYISSRSGLPKTAGTCDSISVPASCCWLGGERESILSLNSPTFFPNLATVPGCTW